MQLAKRLAVGLALLACGCPSTHDGGQSDSGVPEASAPAWQTVLQGLDGAVLSVWGTGPNDVFAVGGSRGNGYPTLALHFDGAAWKRLAPGGNDTYWWVRGTTTNDVWMVGEGGRITHWDGAAFKDYASGTTVTLFGVWASSPTDAWAVGGTPTGSTADGGAGENDVVLHWDGTAWTHSPLPMTFGRTYFKVWGSGADDVYIVGEAGTIWHRTGGAWKLESMPPLAHGTLLTVNGCGPNEVYAVGGRDVLHSDGTTWNAVNVMLTNDLAGVACDSPGSVAIVGFGGAKQRLVGGVWEDDFIAPPHADLHGAWADGAGAFWTGGGDYISNATPMVRRNGVLARYGAGTVSSTITP
jgi:hypothetical protein